MDFWKFAIFCISLKYSPRSFKNVPNDWDSYHNKKIEGGGGVNPPRQPVSKPGVRLNRVKLEVAHVFILLVFSISLLMDTFQNYFHFYTTFNQINSLERRSKHNQHFILIFEFWRKKTSLCFPHATHGFPKKICQFGPAVCPAIGNIYEHMSEKLYYTDRYSSEYKV